MIRFTDCDPTLPELRHPVITLGTFDGVHLGHHAILGRAVEDARARDGHSVVVTFDPHPRQVLNPAIAPDLLTTTAQRLTLIEQAGIDALCVIEFTRAFANSDPAKFVTSFLVERLRMQEMVVGHDTRFGMHRRGDRTLLERLGPQHGFDVVEVGALQVQDQTVSSTLIRELLQLGDLKLANALLGRRFSLIGEIVRGDGMGRKLGFPTANLQPYQEVIPPNGVYAVFVHVGERTLHGTMNIGVRPTFRHRAGRTIEVHIHEFGEDLYGQEIEIELVEHLRDEQQFESVDALTLQIARDVEHTRQRLLAASD